MAERSGLWPSVELAGPYGGLQQTFLCPLLTTGDSDEAAESRTEEESENDDQEEEPQDINVDDD